MKLEKNFTYNLSIEPQEVNHIVMEMVELALAKPELVESLPVTFELVNKLNAALAKQDFNPLYVKEQRQTIQTALEKIGMERPNKEDAAKNEEDVKPKRRRRTNLTPVPTPEENTEE